MRWFTKCACHRLPLYAGLRRNEVKTLRWSNLVLGESGRLLRIHAAVNKNRKEQALPLHRELNPAEIIVHGVNRHHVFVVLNLL